MSTLADIETKLAALQAAVTATVTELQALSAALKVPAQDQATIDDIAGKLDAMATTLQAADASNAPPTA